MRRRRAASRGRKLRPAQALPTSATPHQQTSFEHERTTKRRGEISELAFALAAARRGFGISRPYGDSERYDIILDPLLPESSTSEGAPLLASFARSGKAPRQHYAPFTRPRLIRVQVKATTQMQSGVYRVNAHRRINGRAVAYKLSEIDFFAAYVIPE